MTASPATARININASAENTPFRTFDTRPHRVTPTRRRALRSFRVSNGWDYAAFGNYIRRAAANLGLERPADISRATGVTPSLLSKWFRGMERPSMASLHKVAEGLRVPLVDLIVLTGRASEADLDTATPQLPPTFDAHPLAVELNRMLADDSPLSAEQRGRLELVVDHSMDPYRGLLKRRRSSGAG